MKRELAVGRRGRENQAPMDVTGSAGSMSFTLP
jgi:hypothetical protein